MYDGDRGIAEDPQPDGAHSAAEVAVLIGLNGFVEPAGTLERRAGYQEIARRHIRNVSLLLGFLLSVPDTRHPTRFIRDAIVGPNHS